MGILLITRLVHQRHRLWQRHSLPSSPHRIHNRLRHRRHPPRDQDLRPEGGPPEFLRARLRAVGEHARDLRQLVRLDRQLPLPLPHHDARAGHAELHGLHLQDVPPRLLRHTAAQLLRRIRDPRDPEIPPR